MSTLAGSKITGVALSCIQTQRTPIDSQNTFRSSRDSKARRLRLGSEPRLGEAHRYSQLSFGQAKQNPTLTSHYRVYCYHGYSTQAKAKSPAGVWVGEPAQVIGSYWSLGQGYGPQTSFSCCDCRIDRCDEHWTRGP